MFDFIRSRKKALLIGLMVLILPGFFLFGIEGFTRMGDKAETVATVAGQNITQTEWDAAIKDDAERVQQNSPSIDPKVFDSSEFRQAALERLVRQRVLAAAAKQLHLSVSDQRLAAELLQNPVLASLRQPDGKIDDARYKELLAPQGLTPQGFEARVRSDLSAQQVVSNLGRSGMAPHSLSDIALGAYFERREIQVLPFVPTDFYKQIKPTDAEIEAFYKANASLFYTTEKASIEYVVLDIETIKKSITPTEVEIKAFYDQNASQMSGSEERKASHILINAPKSASAQERENAKKQAQAILEQVKKAPAQFADIAKKQSQDSASAVNGGDLGYFSRSAMVKPFADAAFAMQPKQISDLVESDFGFHIIQLIDIKQPKIKTLAEMRSDIEAEIKKQQAQKKYAEAAEIFSNLVYEQSDSLKPVAEKLKLDVKTAQDLGRQPGPQSRGPLANSKFLNLLFAPDALEKKRNTEAVELGGNQLVAGRITAHTPAQTKPLQDVKELAQTLLTARLAEEKARAAGAAKLIELKAKADTLPADLGKPVIVARDATNQQPIKLIEAVLKTAANPLPAWIGVDLGTDGYRIVRINKIAEGGQPLANQNREQFVQLWTNAEASSYYEYLKQKFKVSIKATKRNSPL